MADKKNRGRQSFDDGLSGKGGFGGNTGRLKDWKESGSIVVFVHANSGITPRLFHLIPYVTKDEDGKKVLRYFPFVCHEDPSTYFSKAPAQHCPIERAIDILSEDGTIEDDTIVWSANIGNKQKDKSVSKLDFCGIKGGDWRGSFKARAQYVIVVVNAEKPEDGLQIDVEPQTLGDSLMSVIKKEIDSSGQEIDDPRINPYAFKFTYDDNAEPKSKYSTYPYRRAEISEEILELLNKPEVDIDGYIEPGDTKKLRELFENHFEVKNLVSLNEIFSDALDSDSSESSTSDEEESESSNTSSDTEASVSTRTKCETCDGKGTVGKKNVQCPVCEGSGYEQEEEASTSSDEPVNMIPCETCDGKGVVGKKGVQCPVCEGTGLVEEEEETKPTSSEETKKENEEVDKKAKKAAADKKRREEAKQQKAEEKKNQAPKEEPPTDVVYDTDTKCGGCSRAIPDDATKCPFCGAEFGDDDEEGD
jgi:hypothetical protein